MWTEGRLVSRGWVVAIWVPSGSLVGQQRSEGLVARLQVVQVAVGDQARVGTIRREKCPPVRASGSGADGRVYAVDLPRLPQLVAHSSEVLASAVDDRLFARKRLDDDPDLVLDCDVLGLDTAADKKGVALPELLNPASDYPKWVTRIEARVLVAAVDGYEELFHH